MPSSGRLIIIAGLPGTGKCTLAKELAAQHAATIFSPDDRMTFLDINLWDTARREAIERLQWPEAQNIMRLGGTAIIEWGTWSREERHVLRERARAIGAAVELRFLDAPVEELHRRMTERGREVPPMSVEQLTKFSAAIERPTDAEFSLFDPPMEVAP
jgi:predicted kinase